MWNGTEHVLASYWQRHLTDVNAFVIHAVEVVLLYIATRIVIHVAARALKNFLHSRAVRLGDRRRDTLYSLFDNVLTYVLYFFFILMALDTLGVHIMALLAGAGIAGLALGFGAQGLIKDILTGFFILFEDQYGVGDAVAINGSSGTVVGIGLRLTKVKGSLGELYIIPNGQISSVTNYSTYNASAVIDIGISYEADIDQACAIMRRELEAMQKDFPVMTGPVSIAGVQTLDTSSVVLRASAECKPNTSGAVVREAQKRIKLAFDGAGIELPYPQTVVTLQDKRPERQAEG
ncbi:MAG: mechanosensitive ion channel family protein [Firmicutes bacterium]|nr:mechanosensitive ion channel family protein [Bacillota bacterium]